jgi:ADP-ribosylglycohydrolase
MIGAIIGDFCGSVYEKNPIMYEDYPLIVIGLHFTDDTVMTIAVADAIINKKPYSDTLREYGRKYKHRGYGYKFQKWLDIKEPYIDGNFPINGSARRVDNILTENYNKPYNSFGNGSAMRVSSVGFLYENIDDVLNEAKKSAEVTHNHPEGIKGAQAVALAVYMARTGSAKDAIKTEIEKRFKYDLSKPLSEICETYIFDSSCQGSVPQAIIAFLESTDFESAIRNALYLKGDADTQACIAGGIAEAYYKAIPQYLQDMATSKISDEMNIVLNDFYEKIGNKPDGNVLVVNKKVSFLDRVFGWVF